VDNRVFLIDGDLVALRPSAMDVDAVAFERLAATDSPETLEQAVAWYQGDLLEGLGVTEGPFEEWLLTERERLRELAVEALAKLLAHRSHAGEIEPAIRTALRLVGLDPLQEAAYRALMRLYAQDGRRGAALRQYQVCLGILQRELGAEPEPETKQLYREILQRRAPEAGVPKRTRATPRSRPAIEARARLLACESKGPAPDPVIQPAVPLVGRRHELSQLEAALDDAWNIGGRLVLVRGEAGVGKTRLLHELVLAASARGAGVLVGHSHDTQRVLPFRPWIDAVRAAHVLDDVDLQRSLSAPTRTQLARLFPERAEGGVVVPPAGEDHGALFEAVGELLSVWSSRESLVIVLEDLQWADDMSLRLLAFVASRLTKSPVLFIGTVRDEDLDEGRLLRQVTQEVTTLGRFDDVALQPLERSDMQILVRALAGGRRAAAWGAEVADQVWKLSEGNPFVIVECMRAIQDHSGSEPIATVGLPITVSELIAARRARFAGIPQRLISISAVAGRECSFELLQRTATLTSGDVADGVEELVRRRVFEAIGERFQFAHDRLRQVAYARLLPVRRALLHGAIGDALEELNAERLEEVADQLAHHYAHAGNHDKALTYLVRFAEMARRRYALDAANQALDRALEHVEHLGVAMREQRRLDVLVRKGLILSLLGRFKEIPALMLPHRATVAALNLPTLTGPYHVRLGLTYAYHANYEQARDEAALALRAAEQAGDEAIAGQAHYLLALSDFWRGEHRPSSEHAQRAIRLLTRTGVQHYLGLAYWVLGSSYHLLGEFDQALTAEAECEAVGRSTADARLQSFATLTIGWVLATRGQWEEALEVCERSIKTAREQISSNAGKAYKGFTYVEMGTPTPALPLLEEAVAYFGRIGLRQSEARYLVFLSQANLAAGNLAQAHDQAAHARAANLEIRAAWGAALATQTLGRIALARNELREAAKYLETASEMFTATSARFDLARTALERAKVAHACGQRADATARLQEAREGFRAVKAPRHLERTEHLARALGIVF